MHVESAVVHGLVIVLVVRIHGRLEGEVETGGFAYAGKICPMNRLKVVEKILRQRSFVRWHIYIGQDIEKKRGSEDTH